MMARAKGIAARHLKRAIKDPALREQLTPTYEMGCKRILISNDYYPALAQDNVQLVTVGIKEVRERSIVTADGAVHTADTIIFGTGFRVMELPWAKLIRGKGDRTLGEVLGDSPRSHLGTTFPGFPNLFLLQGPNTGLGHNSVVLMIEHQIRHILKAIKYMRKTKAVAIEATPAAVARFTTYIDRRMRGTVWTSAGCRSWYLDMTGRNSALWPSFVFEFGRQSRRFRPSDFSISSSAGARGTSD